MWVRSASSVSQVTRRIKDLIDGDQDLRDLWVRGEVSNFQRATSGHCYFTLKDSESELRAVMWRNAAIKHTWLPRQGDLVNAYGSISVYERGGAYQLYAESIEPVGEGLLWEAYRRLLERLEAEGLFAQERKRPLPRWPRRIGVVTSRDGAAWRDIMRVTSERYPLVELALAPTLVQGDLAPEQIVRAIRRVNREADIDVMIIARGGGSLEDLWAFNDERVARALAASRIPVVSGIGHETDLTIADLVADYRAATPSAAAAAVTPDRQALRALMIGALDTLRSAISRRLAEGRRILGQTGRVLWLHNPQRHVAEQRQRLDQAVNRMERGLSRQLEMRRAAVSGALARLQALSPRSVLARGYAIVEHGATGARVTHIAQVQPQDELVIYLGDGEIDALVTDARSDTSQAPS